jgi:hypothetical protein
MIRKTLRRTAPFALTSLLILGAAPAAIADSGGSSSTPIPVSEPVVQSQNSPEAQSEAAISKAVAPSNLNDLKAKGAAEIAKRQRTLNDLAAKLGAQTTDCGSNAAMTNEVRNSSVSLATVGVNLAGSADPVAARALYRSIFNDHRIYILVAPKAGKVLRCNAILARSAALTNEAAALQVKLDAAKAGGADTTAAQATKNAGLTLLGTVNVTAVLAPIMGLVPDKGVDSVQASNTAALKAADVALDAAYAIQKQVHSQFEAARKLLRPAVIADKKSDRKTELETKKAKEKAEREARDAARKAERESKKADKKSEKKDKKDNDDDGDDN